MPSQPLIRLNLSLFSSSEKASKIDWDITRNRNQREVNGHENMKGEGEMSEKFDFFEIKL